MKQCVGVFWCVSKIDVSTVEKKAAEHIVFFFVAFLELDEVPKVVSNPPSLLNFISEIEEINFTILCYQLRKKNYWFMLWLCRIFLTLCNLKKKVLFRCSRQRRSNSPWALLKIADFLELYFKHSEQCLCYHFSQEDTSTLCGERTETKKLFETRSTHTLKFNSHHRILEAAHMVMVVGVRLA